MNIKRQFEEYCMIKLGFDYKAEIFKKAYAKAERWAAQAYGSKDMRDFKDECGLEGIMTFYNETIEKPDGRRTLNREYNRER